MRYATDKNAPEPARQGYWDADNVIKLFLDAEGQLRSEHPPSPFLFVTLRDMTARGVSDAQEYLDGWNQRFEDLAAEARGEWQKVARAVAGLGTEPTDPRD